MFLALKEHSKSQDKLLEIHLFAEHWKNILRNKTERERSNTWKSLPNRDLRQIDLMRVTPCGTFPIPSPTIRLLVMYEKRIPFSLFLPATNCQNVFGGFRSCVYLPLLSVHSPRFRECQKIIFVSFADQAYPLLWWLWRWVLTRFPGEFSPVTIQKEDKSGILTW